MGKSVRKRPESQGFNARTVQQMLPAAAMFGELRELVIHAGLRAVEMMLEAERTAVCGAPYERQEDRGALRMGHAPGELVLGGRRVSVKRPRARTRAKEEVVLPSWKRFSAEDPLTARAVEQMVVGVSTRKYARSLEPLAQGVHTRGTSRSAVSRRFVAATQEQLDGWMASDLRELNLVAVMIDGICFREHVVLCALGIEADGNKRVLGLQEGATENAVACTELLTNLRERGLRTDRALLMVIDGSKALAKAAHDVFGRFALIQRCQVHKTRNVLEQLPENKRGSIRKAMYDAYRSRSADTARRLLNNLERTLRKNHPGAAASLREGLDETLTVLELGLGATLERSLSTTNAIENLNGNIRRITRRVKTWRDGNMILRWVAAAVTEAAKGFRRFRGFQDLKKLRAALDAHTSKLTKTVDAPARAVA
jgi:putative transposase